MGRTGRMEEEANDHDEPQRVISFRAMRLILNGTPNKVPSRRGGESVQRCELNTTFYNVVILYPTQCMLYTLSHGHYAI